MSGRHPLNTIQSTTSISGIQKLSKLSYHEEDSAEQKGFTGHSHVHGNYNRAQPKYNTYHMITQKYRNQSTGGKHTGDSERVGVCEKFTSTSGPALEYPAQLSLFCQICYLQNLHPINHHHIKWNSMFNNLRCKRNENYCGMQWLAIISLLH